MSTVDMSNECIDSYFLSKLYRKKCDPNNRPEYRATETTKQIIASSAGSMTSILALNPLNVLKVRLQNSHSSLESVSVTNIARNIFRSEGLRGFWAGTSVALTMSLPNTVLFMTAYERCKLLLRGPSDQPQSAAEGKYIPALAGGLARIFSVTIISPLELARTIKAAGKTETTVQIITEVFRQEGLRGLYRGWVPTLARDVPFSAIYWFNIELWKPIFYNLLTPLSSNQEGRNGGSGGFQTSASVFLAGSTSALISAVITHPFDVVKTQRQLANSSSPSSSSSASAGVIRLLQQEGLYGIFRGISMRLLTVIPGSAILLTVYEAVKSLDF